MNWFIDQEVELTKGAIAGEKRTNITPLAYPGSANAHQWRVYVKNHGIPLDLTGNTVTAYFQRSDGNVVVVQGDTIDNMACVIIPAEVYAISGIVKAYMDVVLAGTAITPVAGITFNVPQNMSGDIIDPGEVIPASLEELLAEIDAMRQATAEARTVVSSSVRYDAAQTLTDAQKERARGNIDAASVNDVEDLKTQFNQITKNIDATFIDGRYAITSSGRVINYSANNKTCAKIDVSLGATYRVSFTSYGSSSDVIIVADEFLTALSSIKGTATRTNTIVDVQIQNSRAAYLFVTHDTQLSPAINPTIKQIISVEYVDAKVSPSEKLIDYLDAGYHETSKLDNSQLFLGAKIFSSGDVKPAANESFKVQQYSVESGATYLLSGKNVRIGDASVIAAFGDAPYDGTNTVSCSIQIVDNTYATIETDYSILFKAPSNGYIFIASYSDYNTLGIYDTEYYSKLLCDCLDAGSRITNVNATKTEGKYYDPDGNLRAYASAASAKVAVKKNEKYYYSGFIREGYASVGFENSGGTFTLVNLEEGWIHDYEIIVPQNATYLCLSTWNDERYPLIVKKLTKVLIDGNYIYDNIEYSDQVIQTLNDGNIYDRCFSIENRIGFSFKGMNKGKIIFMSDDAKAVVSDLYNHFHSHQMPFSEAVPLDMLYTIANNGEKTINTLRAIVQDGGEILSHGLTGHTCNIETCGSLENVERELRDSKSGLVGAGFDIHGWVSPQGIYEPAAVTLYPKYYRYGYMASNKNGSQFNMERIYLTNLGLAGAKAKVDEVETNRSIVILFSHFSNTELNVFSFEDLEELLTYIATKNVDVTTYRDCFYQYGSIT